MINRMKKISLGNWILIGMILGLIVGLFLNLSFKNDFIENTLIMDNFLYLGGNVFIRLMKMLVVPLVFCSIVISLTSISNIRKIGTIGLRSILFYFLTTIIATFIAFGVATIIKPGISLNMTSIPITSAETANQTITNTLLNIIPENPLNALINGDMLPLIIFGVLIGFILVKLRDETPIVNKLFKESNHIMITMTELIMKFAPIGVFCMIARTFGTLGFETMIPLAKLIISLVIGFSIQTFIIYPLLIIIFTRLNPLKFFKKYISVMFFAFSSISSSASIPLSINKLKEMGVSRDISSFTIPLGTAINQDGAALIFGIAVMFGAQAYGIDLGTSILITAIFSIIIASTSTPSVPLAGVFSITIIFNSISMPIQVIDLIIGIYTILDMFITTDNTTGNAVCTLLVASKDKSFDTDAYNAKKDPKKMI